MSYETCLLKKCDNLKPKRRWVKEIFQNILECFYSQMPDVFLSFLGKDFKLILISYSLQHIEYILHVQKNQLICKISQQIKIFSAHTQK